MSPLIELVDDRDAIADDAVLLRRVKLTALGGNKPELAGQKLKLSGNAFKDYSQENAEAQGFIAPCMSVAVESILHEYGKTAQDLLISWGSEYGIAAFSAEEARALVKADGSPCPQGLMLAPTEDEPWHAVVFDTAGQRRSDAVAKRLSMIADWMIPLTHTH